MGKSSGSEEEQATYCISQGDCFGGPTLLPADHGPQAQCSYMGAENAGEAPAGLGPMMVQEDGLISQPVLSIPNPI